MLVDLKDLSVGVNHNVYGACVSVLVCVTIIIIIVILHNHVNFVLGWYGNPWQQPNPALHSAHRAVQLATESAP